MSRKTHRRLVRGWEDEGREERREGEKEGGADPEEGKTLHLLKHHMLCSGTSVATRVSWENKY